MRYCLDKDDVRRILTALKISNLKELASLMGEYGLCASSETLKKQISRDGGLSSPLSNAVKACFIMDMEKKYRKGYFSYERYFEEFCEKNSN